MMIRRAAIGAITAAALSATWMGAALADSSSSSSSNTSTTTTEQSKPPRLIDKIAVKYYGAFAGPAVSEIVSPYTHNPDGSVGDPLSMSHTLYGGYRIQKGMTLYALGTVMTTIPMPEVTQPVSVADPALQLSVASVMKRGNFVMSGTAAVSPGLIARSVNGGKIATFSLSQTPIYELAGTRWTILGYFKESVTLLSDKATVGKSSDGSLYGYASVNYQWKPNLSINFGADSRLIHKLGMGFDGFTISQAETTFTVGASWDVIKNLNLSPFLSMYPIQGISPDSTTINMYVSASFL